MKTFSFAEPCHWTFGIPLESCISNDVILGRLTDIREPGHDGVKGHSAGGGGNARLLDALTLSVGNPKPRSVLQVPYLVLTCCSYIRQNGNYFWKCCVRSFAAFGG